MKFIIFILLFCCFYSILIYIFYKKYKFINFRISLDIFASFIVCIFVFLIIIQIYNTESWQCISFGPRIVKSDIAGKEVLYYEKNGQERLYVFRNLWFAMPVENDKPYGVAYYFFEAGGVVPTDGPLDKGSFRIVYIDYDGTIEQVFPRKERIYVTPDGHFVVNGKLMELEFHPGQRDIRKNFPIRNYWIKDQPPTEDFSKYF